VYEYTAVVDKVIDGDTIDLIVNLGFHILFKERFRLYGINAYETRGEDRTRGLEAKAFLESCCPEGSTVSVKTVKDQKGKYGRYLASLWLGDVCVNDELVAYGHAVYQKY